MGHDISFQEIPSKDNLSVPVTIIFNPTQSIVLLILQLLMKDPYTNNNRKYYCPFNTYLLGCELQPYLSLSEPTNSTTTNIHTVHVLRGIEFHLKGSSTLSALPSVLARIHLSQSPIPFNHFAECS